jgi:hypothetical protein
VIIRIGCSAGLMWKLCRAREVVDMRRLLLVMLKLPKRQVAAAVPLLLDVAARVPRHPSTGDAAERLQASAFGLCLALLRHVEESIAWCAKHLQAWL